MCRQIFGVGAVILQQLEEVTREDKPRSAFIISKPGDWIHTFAAGPNSVGAVLPPL